MSALALLARNRFRQWVRNPLLGDGTLAGQIVISAIVVLAVTLFLLAPLFALGWTLPVLLETLYPDTPPQQALSRLLLPGFVAAFPVRVLFHAGSRGTLQPYRILPLSRRPLAAADVTLHFASTHTLAALAFLAPAWWQVIRPATSPTESVLWLLAALALVGVWTLAALFLHASLGRRSRWFWGAVVGSLAVGAADVWTEVSLVSAVSGPALQRPWIGLFLFGGTAAILARRVIDARVDALRHSPASATSRMPSWLEAIAHRLSRYGDTGRYAALELRRAFRQRRLRGLLIMGILMGPYVGVIDQMGSGSGDSFLWVLWGMGGGIVLIYAPFVIAAEHAHLDGIITAPANPESMMRGKIVFYQIGVLVCALLNAPMLAFLSADTVWFALAALPLVLGVMAPMMPWVGAGTPVPMDPGRSVFSFSANTSLHTLPLIVPFIGIGVVAIVFDATGQAFWLLALAAPGLAGLAAFRFWARTAARRLHRRRHRLVRDLRTKDPL